MVQWSERIVVLCASYSRQEGSVCQMARLTSASQERWQRLHLLPWIVERIKDRKEEAMYPTAHPPTLFFLFGISKR